MARHSAPRAASSRPSPEASDAGQVIAPSLRHAAAARQPFEQRYAAPIFPYLQPPLDRVGGHMSWSPAAWKPPLRAAASNVRTVSSGGS
jgi:hypothetical protein